VFNDWVHQHTPWKVFFHTCGSIVAFLDDFVEVGVDIINPVQFTAAGMELRGLKVRYGDRLVFWGGGVDPQRTLPFGTPEEVAQETCQNVGILSQGGGYVCAAVHNIQGPTPVENILAFFRAINADV
jgi:uroporphyrinogen-III decarboxylase